MDNFDHYIIVFIASLEENVMEVVFESDKMKGKIVIRDSYLDYLDIALAKTKDKDIFELEFIFDDDSIFARYEHNRIDFVSRTRLQFRQQYKYDGEKFFPAIEKWEEVSKVLIAKSEITKDDVKEMLKSLIEMLIESCSEEKYEKFLRKILNVIYKQLDKIRTVDVKV